MPRRDEIITTIFSHPCDAGAPATAGYKVITLMSDPETGMPSPGSLPGALSERTAAIFIPPIRRIQASSIPRLKEIVDAAHEAGALCYYDQANVNGIMTITRAKEIGADLIHYNLHKTFSSPHGGMGPGVGALCVRGTVKGISARTPGGIRRQNSIIWTAIALKALERSACSWEMPT